jgi:phosphate transport system substrate-binding protein
MKRINTAIFVLFVFLAAPCCKALAAESLIGSGCSVSVPGYLQDLAREYEKETGVKMLVLGGGSIRGLTDLQAGRIDFAASCVSKSADDPEDFEFIAACWDALVFIVHKSNPVTNINSDQERNIYAGKITNWQELGGPDLPLISIISTPKGMGGIGEALSKMILKGKAVSKQKNSSLQASSTAIWEQLVEDMPEGFASTGFGSARKRNVRMLTVNGVPPTRENIITGRYPYRRPLFLVIKKNPRPEIRKFVDFVLSKKGQALISSYGMPSLADLK